MYETKLSVLIEGYLPGTSVNYVLGAYNEFYKYIDPISNDTLHLVGFEANISGSGYPTWNGYYSGAFFAKRDAGGQYAIEEINGFIGQTDTALVASRCSVKSPFAGENSLYFGGFNPNGSVATNMAWIYKNYLLINSTAEINKNVNNFAICPNPAINQIFIESETLRHHEFSIFNLLGEKVVSRKLNGNIETINISFLTLNIYFLRIANETVKLIKSKS